MQPLTSSGFLCYHYFLMELSPKQQIVELITKSQNILLVTHKNPDGDAIGSILALDSALRVLGKKLTSICAGEIPVALRFLPGQERIKKQAAVSRDFIIALDTRQVQVEKLGYKQRPKENRMDIVVTAKEGRFTPEHVSFGPQASQFDLVIVLDSPDLERLGDFYDNNTEIFYEVPLINIDHHSSNDYFGKVNWVDLAASSTSEILVALLEALAQSNRLFTEDISTYLLTGIITDTNSFQNANTTPKSLTVAAQLVALGARQQEIILNIFKTTPISTLKLWGIILSKLQNEEKLRFVWSQISRQEMEKVGASFTEIGGVIDGLLKSVPEADFTLLISERNGSIHGSLRAIKRNVDVSAMAQLFGGGGHSQAAAFEIKDGRGMEETVSEIVSRIRAYQSQRLQG
jgi:phosphoesterase RecJ-like protein